MAGPAPSLFGLAPNGVCRACRIAAASGGLLLHRFTLTACAAVCFLWRCPRVAPPGRYPASCPAEPGLSSPGLAARSDDPSRSRRKIQNILSLKRFAFQPLRPDVRGKSAVFPLSSGRAALCRSLLPHPSEKARWGKDGGLGGKETPLCASQGVSFPPKKQISHAEASELRERFRWAARSVRTSK